jgi:hypothetical protein
MTVNIGRAQLERRRCSGLSLRFREPFVRGQPFGPPDSHAVRRKAKEESPVTRERSPVIPHKLFAAGIYICS